MSPVPKTINNLPWCLSLMLWPCILKKSMERRVCGEMVVEYQKSLMDFLICQLSSILSIFLNQVLLGFFFFVPKWNLLLISGCFWRYIGSRTLSPQARAQRKRGLVGFLWGWRRVGGGVSSSCDSVHLSAPLFAHTLFWLGAHFQCVALPGKGCTRWWQWRLIRQRYTGSGFPAEPGQFLPALGTKQHLLTAALLASVVNPNEFLSRQSDYFTTGRFKLMIFRENQIYHVKI